MKRKSRKRKIYQNLLDSRKFHPRILFSFIRKERHGRSDYRWKEPLTAATIDRRRRHKLYREWCLLSHLVNTNIIKNYPGTISSSLADCTFPRLFLASPYYETSVVIEISLLTPGLGPIAHRHIHFILPVHLTFNNHDKHPRKCDDRFPACHVFIIHQNDADIQHSGRDQKIASSSNVFIQSRIIAEPQDSRREMGAAFEFHGCIGGSTNLQDPKRQGYHCRRPTRVLATWIYLANYRLHCETDQARRPSLHFSLNKVRWITQSGPILLCIPT